MYVNYSKPRRKNNNLAGRRRLDKFQSLNLVPHSAQHVKKNIEVSDRIF